MSKKYTLAWTTDFHDELVHAWFDEKRLTKLFSLFKSWGMSRVYWVDTYPFFEGFFDACPTQSTSKNAKRTYENMGDFLPAAVKVAHNLDLELFCVYKPYDMGLPFSLPTGTKEANRYGKIDCLGGKLHWTLNNLAKLRDKRLSRHPADLSPQSCKKEIHAIKLTAQSQDQPWFGKDNITLLISDDNNRYTTYKKDFEYRQTIENSQRVVYLEKLEISAPFIAVKCEPPVATGAFVNTLDKLIVLLDKSGDRIPFTYSFSPRNNIQAKGPKGEKRPVAFAKNALGGYKFDDGSAFDSSLNQTRKALDASPQTIIALARGKETYISGALSPAWSESRELWLSHIKFALKSGVDGVDIRTAAHNRSYEWERYGFEEPVVQAYKKRYAVDITKEKFSPANHRRILGEFHTLFLSEARNLIHTYGKKAQVHILSTDIHPSQGNHYMNFHWEWKKWLTKLAFDAVTIKDGPWTDHSVWQPIREIADRHKINTFFCPYWKSVVNKSNWRKKLMETLKESRETGHAGFILYESAMTTYFKNDGHIELLNPDLPKILKTLTK